MTRSGTFLALLAWSDERRDGLKESGMVSTGFLDRGGLALRGDSVGDPRLQRWPVSAF